MQSNNVSSPIIANEIGWFRYNYDKNRLEFINDDTKMVVQFWDIPIDQWESLPSKRTYCENIINSANRQEKQQRKINSIALVCLLLCVFVAAFCWTVYDRLYDYDLSFGTHYSNIDSTVEAIAAAGALASFFKIKK
ncbi:MAG: hypothetical protein K5755_00565 [Clostridiales bacterium]|nr:hypothetical protein [Clostridiales bacterium]